MRKMKTFKEKRFARQARINYDSGLSALAKWLPYQVYCSRFYGRAGYYQISGAYGFRDQLQDCLTMLYIDCAAVKNILFVAQNINLPPATLCTGGTNLFSE